MKKEKPLMILKFGSIKYANYSESPEAMALADKHNGTDDKEIKADIIRLFNGDFYLWWENRGCTKDEAIEYVLKYINC